MPKDFHAKARIKDIGKKAALELATTGKSSFEYIWEDSIPQKGKSRPEKSKRQSVVVEALPPLSMVTACLKRMNDFFRTIETLPHQSRIEKYRHLSWQINNSLYVLQLVVRLSGVSTKNKVAKLKPKCVVAIRVMVQREMEFLPI